MREMTPEETRSFLTTNGRTATIATVRPDGRLHAVPIWTIFDGDDVVFTTWHASVKAANLRRGNQAVISFDDRALPLDFFTIEGTMTIIEHPLDFARSAPCTDSSVCLQIRSHRPSSSGLLD